MKEEVLTWSIPKAEMATSDYSPFSIAAYSVPLVKQSRWKKQLHRTTDVTVCEEAAGKCTQQADMLACGFRVCCTLRIFIIVDVLRHLPDLHNVVFRH